ncbi:MAG: hypothetical protein ACPG4X_19640 [Pikeienuella sp.]
MPTFQITGPDGNKYRVTGDSEEGALGALQRHLGEQPSQLNDFVRSAMTGLRGGVESTLGAIGSTGELQQSAAKWLTEKAGGSPELAESIGSVARHATFLPGSPSTKDIRSITDRMIGHGYEPKTTAGEYARTLGQFAPAAALGPGRLAQRLAYTALPAIASETAGQFTKGSAVEPYARFGAALGGVVAAPGAMAASNTIGGMLGIGNTGRAKTALAEALARSGKTATGVADDMASAALEGQSGYSVVDSLGHTGQRMLSGIARQPGDMRQSVVNALDARQAGQSRRIASFLDDAFGSQQGTALQKTAADRSARSTAAGVNYSAARESAGSVNVSDAISKLDDIVAPGLTKIAGAGAANTGVLSTLKRARDMLGKGKAQVSNFDRAFAVKYEWDKIIADNLGNPISAKLIPARNALDDALAAASKPYAGARDLYRQQSKAIDAIDAGKKAATRGRFEDTRDAMRNMSDQEMAGFRVGYADPLIAKTQKAAPGVNNARSLVHDKAKTEFPLIAGQDRGDKLLRQMDRENIMFETRRQTTGGSQTADNLADQIDIASFDPSIITSLSRGQIGPSIVRAMEHASNIVKGRNSSTRDLIAQQLIQSDAKQARAALTDAMRHSGQLTPVEKSAIRAVVSLLPAARPLPPVN